MFSLTNRVGPGCVRLRRVTIGPLKNCASPWAMADALSQGEKVAGTLLGCQAVTLTQYKAFFLPLTR